MALVRISREGFVAAPPDIVYDCIADYTNHHPQILPDNFSDFRVESGGRGAGTVMSFRFKAAGSTRSYRGEVTEPEPGRLIAETYADGSVTSFLVEPAPGGSRVVIETSWQPKGVQGLFERLMAPRILPPIYARELEKLDAYARLRASGSA
jgi:hypothetical protein